MSIKVIGAGFSRTGTFSLRSALEHLGFRKCYHMTEILNDHPEHIGVWRDAYDGKRVDWSSLFSGFQATVDLPGCLFYKQILNDYPNAKVILTLRDPDSWYNSMERTIYQSKLRGYPSAPSFRKIIHRIMKKPSRSKEFGDFHDHLVWDGFFEGHFTDKDFAIKVYLEHVEKVKKLVPPEKLLVMEINEGWEPLCNFLKVPIPDSTPFPHLNEQTQFTRVRRAAKRDV